MGTSATIKVKIRLFTPLTLSGSAAAAFS